MLVRDLRRQHELGLVVGRGLEERREQPRDVELGVESVREHPDEPATVGLVETGEAGRVRRKVERKRRPLVPLPVLVECRKGRARSSRSATSRR